MGRTHARRPVPFTPLRPQPLQQLHVPALSCKRACLGGPIVSTFVKPFQDVSMPASSGGGERPFVPLTHPFDKIYPSRSRCDVRWQQQTVSFKTFRYRLIEADGFQCGQGGHAVHVSLLLPAGHPSGVPLQFVTFTSTGGNLIVQVAELPAHGSDEAVGGREEAEYCGHNIVGQHPSDEIILAVFDILHRASNASVFTRGLQIT
eukprot:CAMPEP_0194351458 /NCGR_PEP_ID=MMETSP0171-20130528/108191_1 /TAXON_ID=218684 /ORGANISM="Corethron pennatum, Strain L29A3" /LENGTH=203 /DNA_ID=CAMNT_0039119091 /DNA_START=515 /DNA_END=1122 /DNA_ORIENTATION=+